MITRKVIAIAVMLPFLIAPAIAQQHQGGPQSTVPHDMRQPKTSNVDNTANKKLAHQEIEWVNLMGNAA